jgi:hypothetical protein
VRRAGRRTPILLAAVVTALTVAGCPSVDSVDVRTNGMKAEIVVRVADGLPEAQVDASLRAGTTTFVDLGEGEKMVARSGTTSTTLAKGDLPGESGYGGRLPGVYRPGSEVVVGLARNSTDVSAPNSKVRLAVPVAFVAPESGGRFSRSQEDIEVRIRSRPTNQATELSWEGDCVVGGGFDVAPGQTTVTITRGMIHPAAPSTTGTTPAAVPPVCKVTLKLTRRVPGSLDPGFGGGSIVAEAQSTRDISSVP